MKNYLAVYSPDSTPASSHDARAESDRNRAAELNAQTIRLDKDRLILAALDALEHNAYLRVGPRGLGAYLAGAANIETRHLGDSGQTYVLQLLTQLRLGVSPLVR